MALSNASKAGIAIFVGTVQYAMFQVLSEVIYAAYGLNGYNESTDYISNLGADCGFSPCYIPPSALLFDASVFFLGLFIPLGAYYLQRAFHHKPTTVLIALAGVGAVGVGVFPETAGILHELSSVVVFLFAGLSAVVAARFQKRVASLFSVILGLITLLALIAYMGGEYAGLGAGGMERIVVWTVLLWGVAFGGHLMAIVDPPRM